MIGSWELWDTDSGNLICGFETEADALKMAREVVEDGWSADDLSLANVDSKDVAIFGDALLARIKDVLG